MPILLEATLDELRLHRYRLRQLLSLTEIYTQAWADLCTQINQVDIQIHQRLTITPPTKPKPKPRPKPKPQPDPEPTPLEVAPDEGQHDPRRLLPVPVTEFRAGGNMPQLRDEIEKRATAMLQWSPWGRRAQRMRRRYEGWHREAR